MSFGFFYLFDKVFIVMYFIIYLAHTGKGPDPRGRPRSNTLADRSAPPFPKIPGMGEEGGRRAAGQAETGMERESVSVS